MVDLNKVAIGLVAGATGGLVASFGARVAMRVIALLGGQPPSFTLEGTLFILILGAAMGAVMGLPLMAIRRILPGTGRSVLQKGLIFGLLIFLVFMVIPFLVFLARGELEAEGEFALVPPLGVLGLFAPLPFVYGIIAEALMIWLERRTLPITPGRRIGILWLVVFGSVLLLGATDPTAHWPLGAGLLAVGRVKSEA